MEEPAAPITNSNKRTRASTADLTAVPLLQAMMDQLRGELATVRMALDSERSAVRALKRDRTAEIKAVREEEARKCRDALCNLKSRLEHEHEESLQRQKEAVTKVLNADLLRTLKAKDSELHRELAEAHVREEALKLQARDALRAATRDAASTLQLSGANSGEIQKLQQEVSALRTHVKQLEERLQIVVDADRQKAADLRAQHEEHEMQLVQIKKISQQEAHRLLEELKSKERLISQLERQLSLQTGRVEEQRERLLELHNEPHPRECECPEDTCARGRERRLHQRLSELQTTMKKASEVHAQEKKEMMRKLRDLEGKTQPLKLCKNSNNHNTPATAASTGEESVDLDSVDSRVDTVYQQLETQQELENLRAEIEERDRVITELKQAARENDRKLDHLSNRHRKEQMRQYYRFMELEPVAEQEEDSGAGEDSASSSGSPSLSPQPFEGDMWIEFTNKEYQDSLYPCLLKEHLELQKEYQLLQIRQKRELAEPNRIRLRLEIELAAARTHVRELKRMLAEQKGANNVLNERIAALQAEAHDLREQNEVLEFRILELEEYHENSSVRNQGPDTRDVWTDTESDDVSDSGVQSLPTSEDISSDTDLGIHDLKMEIRNEELKSRLLEFARFTSSTAERCCLQQVLALLEAYEMRMEKLQVETCSTVTPSNPSIKSSGDSGGRALKHLPESAIGSLNDSTKITSRIIATVLPFTDLTTDTNNDNEDVKEGDCLKKQLKNAECLQESGIFEETEYFSQSTQTDSIVQPTVKTVGFSPVFENGLVGDLSAEIQKLNHFRELVEERGTCCGNKKLLRVEEGKGDDPSQDCVSHTKELLYCRERLQILEDKVRIYESSGDHQLKLLTERLQKEVRLASQVKELLAKVQHLTSENKHLEEEKCEFEEAENDTRLKYQKLEVKLIALNEKKSDLQAQLQQERRNMSRLRTSLSESERKKQEARGQLNYMETVLNKYEHRNYELEEREVELRHRLEMLETTMPALMMWNLWRMVQDPSKSRAAVNAAVSNTLVKARSGRSQSKMISTRLGGSLYKCRPMTSPELSTDVNPIVCSEQADVKLPKSAGDEQTRLKVLEDDRNRILTERRQAEEKWQAAERQLMERLETLEAQAGPLNTELQRYRDAEEQYKAKIQSLESKLYEKKHGSPDQGISNVYLTVSDNIAQSGVDANVSVPSIGCESLECMRKIQELVQSEASMKKCINELELKEKAYMETLQQADELWSDMENSYKSRIAKAEDSEATLRDTVKRLEGCETKLKQAYRHGEDNDMLMEKLQNMEQNEKQFVDRIQALEAEKNRLLSETNQLREALVASQTELQKTKELVEGPLKDELVKERKLSKMLQEEIRTMENEIQEVTGAHDAEVNGLKAQLTKTSRELIDVECTNSELKEEVETLEAKVVELKYSLEQLKENEEKLVIKMSQTILEKEKELEEANRELQYATTPSAHEELQGALPGIDKTQSLPDNLRPCLPECTCPAAQTQSATEGISQVTAQVPKAGPLLTEPPVAAEMPSVEQPVAVEPALPKTEEKKGVIKPCLSECSCPNASISTAAQSPPLLPSDQSIPTKVSPTVPEPVKEEASPHVPAPPDAFTCVKENLIPKVPVETSAGSFQIRINAVAKLRIIPSREHLQTPLPQVTSGPNIKESVIEKASKGDPLSSTMEETTMTTPVSDADGVAKISVMAKVSQPEKILDESTKEGTEVLPEQATEPLKDKKESVIMKLSLSPHSSTEELEALAVTLPIIEQQKDITEESGNISVLSPLLTPSPETAVMKESIIAKLPPVSQLCPRTCVCGEYEEISIPAKAVSEDSFLYSESEYSRVTAEDFEFGEIGECILEPPVEQKLFTDCELAAAFDELVIETVELGSKECLFQNEFPLLTPVITPPPHFVVTPKEPVEEVVPIAPVTLETPPMEPEDVLQVPEEVKLEDVTVTKETPLEITEAAAIDVTKVTPKVLATETAPEVLNASPEVTEDTPEVTEAAPGAKEVTPEVVEAPPEIVESGTEIIEVVSKLAEVPTEEKEVALEVIDTSPLASEPVIEAFPIEAMSPDVVEGFEAPPIEPSVSLPVETSAGNIQIKFNVVAKLHTVSSKEHHQTPLPTLPKVAASVHTKGNVIDPFPSTVEEITMTVPVSDSDGGARESGMGKVSQPEKIPAAQIDADERLPSLIPAKEGEFPEKKVHHVISASQEIKKSETVPSERDVCPLDLHTTCVCLSLLTREKMEEILSEKECIPPGEAASKAPPKEPASECPPELPLSEAPPETLLSKIPSEEPVCEASLKPQPEETVSKPLPEESVSEALSEETVSKAMLEEPVSKAMSEEPVSKVPPEEHVGDSLPNDPAVEIEADKPVAGFFQEEKSVDVTEATVEEPILKVMIEEPTGSTLEKPVGEPIIETAKEGSTQEAFEEVPSDEPIREFLLEESVPGVTPEGPISETGPGEAVVEVTPKEPISKIPPERSAKVTMEPIPSEKVTKKSKCKCPFYHTETPQEPSAEVLLEAPVAEVLPEEPVVEVLLEEPAVKVPLEVSVTAFPPEALAVDKEVCPEEPIITCKCPQEIELEIVVEQPVEMKAMVESIASQQAKTAEEPKKEIPIEKPIAQKMATESDKSKLSDEENVCEKEPYDVCTCPEEELEDVQDVERKIMTQEPIEESPFEIMVINEMKELATDEVIEVSQEMPLAETKAEDVAVEAPTVVPSETIVEPLVQEVIRSMMPSLEMVIPYVSKEALIEEVPQKIEVQTEVLEPEIIEDFPLEIPTVEEMKVELSEVPTEEIERGRNEALLIETPTVGEVKAIEEIGEVVQEGMEEAVMEIPTAEEMKDECIQEPVEEIQESGKEAFPIETPVVEEMKVEHMEVPTEVVQESGEVLINIEIPTTEEVKVEPVEETTGKVIPECGEEAAEEAVGLQEMELPEEILVTEVSEREASLAVVTPVLKDVVGSAVPSMEQIIEEKMPISEQPVLIEKVSEKLGEDELCPLGANSECICPSEYAEKLPSVEPTPVGAPETREETKILTQKPPEQLIVEAPTEIDVLKESKVVPSTVIIEPIIADLVKQSVLSFEKIVAEIPEVKPIAKKPKDIEEPIPSVADVQPVLEDVVVSASPSLEMVAEKPAQGLREITKPKVMSLEILREIVEPKEQPVETGPSDILTEKPSENEEKAVIVDMERPVEITAASPPEEMPTGIERAAEVEEHATVSEESPPKAPPAEKPEGIEEIEKPHEFPPKDKEAVSLPLEVNTPAEEVSEPPMEIVALTDAPKEKMPAELEDIPVKASKEIVSAEVQEEPVEEVNEVKLIPVEITEKPLEEMKDVYAEEVTEGPEVVGISPEKTLEETKQAIKEVEEATLSAINVLSQLIERSLEHVHVEEHSEVSRVCECCLESHEGDPIVCPYLAKKVGLPETSVKAMVPTGEGVETVVTSGLAGQADAALMQQLEDLMREKTELQEYVNNLEQLVKIKSAEMLETRNKMSNLQKRLAGEDAYPPEESISVHNTVSELQTILATLQEKCRLKDQMITALANDLRLRAASGHFDDLIRNVQTQESERDFDQEQLCEYLKTTQVKPKPPAHDRQEIIMTVKPKFTARTEDQIVAIPTSSKKSARSVHSSTSLRSISPMGLQVLKQVGPDSILLGWNVPPHGSFTGFEIFVNGALAHRVRSPSRNKALLQSLDLKSKVVVTMFALTPRGRVSEPAQLTIGNPANDDAVQRTTESFS